MEKTLRIALLIMTLVTILPHVVEARPANHIRQLILDKQSKKFQETLMLCIDEAQLSK